MGESRHSCCWKMSDALRHWISRASCTHPVSLSLSIIQLRYRSKKPAPWAYGQAIHHCWQCKPKNHHCCFTRLFFRYKTSPEVYQCCLLILIVFTTKKKTWFSSPRCRLDRQLPRGGCRNLRGPRLRPARDSLSPMTFHRWHSYPQIMGFPLGLAILNQIWQAKITRIMYTSTYI